MDNNKLITIEAKVNAILSFLPAIIADAVKMKPEEANGIIAQRVADQVAILKQQAELNKKKD